MLEKLLSLRARTERVLESSECDETTAALEEVLEALGRAISAESADAPAG